jgi:plastocyanin
VAFAATATQGQGGSIVDITLSVSGGGQFNPANVVIAPGTTVRWTWTDSPHTVTSSGSPTFPGHPTQANAPTVYEHTFTTAGSYSYYCVVHGSESAGMRGTVVVQ